MAEMRSPEHPFRVHRRAQGMMMDRCVHPDVHDGPLSLFQASGLAAEVAGAVTEVLAEGV
jgi:hypothetical protein